MDFDEDIVRPWGLFLLDIAKEVKNEELKNIKLILGDKLTARDRESIIDSDDLFKLLEDKRLISEDDTALLRELFRKAEYTELIPRLNEYEANRKKYLEKVSMLAGRRDPLFVGRDSYIRIILDFFKEASHQGLRCVCLWGMAGTGKTKLGAKTCTMYAEMWENPKPRLVLVDLNKKDSIDDFGVAFLSSVKKPVEAKKFKLHLVYDWIRSCEEEYIFLFDNADDLLKPTSLAKDHFQNMLKQTLEWQQNSHIKIIITSRYAGKFPHLDNHPNFKEIEVKSLEMEEAVQLLFKSVQQDPRVNLPVKGQQLITNEQAVRLAEHCGNNPQALQAVASQLRSGKDPEAVLQLLANPMKMELVLNDQSLWGLGQDTTQESGRESNQVLKCLGVMFEDMNPNLKLHLVRLAVFPGLFSQTWGLKILSDVDQEGSRRQSDSKTLEFELDDVADTSLLLRESLDIFKSGVRRDARAREKFYSMHPLVRCLCLMKVEADEKMKRAFHSGLLSFIDECFQIFRQFNAYDDEDACASLQRLEKEKANITQYLELKMHKTFSGKPHPLAKYLLEYKQVLHRSNMARESDILAFMERFMFTKERSKFFDQRAEAAKICGDMPGWVKYKGWYADQELQFHKFKEAETAIANPLSYCEAQVAMTPDLREGYSQCLYVKGNILVSKPQATGHIQSKKREEGIKVLKECIQLRDRLLGNSLVRARSINALGSAYFKGKKYEEALEQHKLALEVLKTVTQNHPETHPDFPFYLMNIGTCYHKLGYSYSRSITQKEKGRRYFEQAIRTYKDGQEALRGVDLDKTPIMGTMLKNLAMTYCEMKDYKKALCHADQATGIRVKTLGDDHPDVARAHYFVGSLYMSLGDQEKKAGKNIFDIEEYTKARECFDRALIVEFNAGYEQRSEDYSDLKEDIKKLFNILDKKREWQQYSLQFKVQTLIHDYAQYPTPDSLHHLLEALCSQPDLTDLILTRRDLNEEFYYTLKAKASSIKAQTLRLHHVQCPTRASSQHLAEALCSMPNLTDLTLESDLNEEFYSTLKANASSLQVQTLKLHSVQYLTSASSHHLVEALCSMPKLTDLKLGRYLNEEFYSSLDAKPFQEFYSLLKAKASSIMVQILKLEDVLCPTPASSHHLAEALCSMPNLTDLIMVGRDLNKEFYSTLKAKASSIKVQTLKLHSVQYLTSASSHQLVEALCSMPKLTDLTLGRYLNEEFYSLLKAKASSIMVQTLKLEDVQCPTPASSHHLAEALCSMPNLTGLTLESDLSEEFYSTLNAKASYIKLTQINTKAVLPKGTSSMSVNEPSGETPGRTETRDIQQMTEGKGERGQLDDPVPPPVSPLAPDSEEEVQFDAADAPSSPPACPSSASPLHVILWPHLRHPTCLEDLDQELTECDNFTSDQLKKLSRRNLFHNDSQREEFLKACGAWKAIHVLNELARRLSETQSMDQSSIMMILGKMLRKLNRKDIRKVLISYLHSGAIGPSMDEKIYIRDLSYRTQRDIGIELSKSQPNDVHDWRCLASDIGCSESIELFAKKDLPGMEVLQTWRTCNEATVGKLYEWAVKGQRWDIVKIMEKDMSNAGSLKAVYDMRTTTTTAAATAAAATFASKRARLQAPAPTFPPIYASPQAASAIFPPMHAGSQASATLPSTYASPQAASATFPPIRASLQSAAIFPPMHAGSQAPAAAKVSQESRWLHLDTTDDGNQVHWDFLTNCPQELTLQDNEAVISCGIRFSPSRAKLSKPIKITLDHNAHFSNPRRAEIVFYTRKKDSKSFERIPASTSSYPRCDVRVKDLDLYVDHFSDWWIVALLTRYFVGKRVNCIPYVLPPVRKEFSHCVYLCIYDDLPDVNDKIDKEMKKYTELHPTQQMFIERKHGDINIKLFEGLKENEKEIGKERLGKRDIYLVDRKQFPFEVKPLEPGERQKFLKFTLNQKESPCDPTSMKFPLPYDDMGTIRTTATTTAATLSSTHVGLQAAAAAATFPPLHAGAQAAEVSTLSQDNLESDRKLDKLSKHMPTETYTTLCTYLGIDYSEAKKILRGVRNDYREATRDCLAQWKTRTGGNMDELETILQDAEVGDLVKYIK